MKLHIPDDLSKARILVTNDDGISAPGIGILTAVAKSFSKDVWVVAPEVEQSGAGHSLTLHQPLRVRKLGAKRFAVSGTPTDCVLLATMEIIPKRTPATLILSGINRGLNVAEDVTYSGTIAAAMEGALLNYPCIAFSQQQHDSEPMLWETGEHYARKVIAALHGLSLPLANFISVNIPHRTPGKVKGIALATQGRRQIEEKLDGRLDPKGRPYYWIGGPKFDDLEDAPGTDHAFIKEGYVTVTPLTLDLTNRDLITKMKKHLGKVAV